MSNMDKFEVKLVAIDDDPATLELVQEALDAATPPRFSPPPIP